MKIYLALSFLCLTLACSQSTEDRSNNQGTGPGTAAKVDTTPYQRCSSGTPVQTIQGAWMQSFEQNGFEFTFMIEVDQDQVRFTNNCSFRGHRLQASVVSSSYYDSSTLAILEKDLDVQRIDTDGFNMNCEVNVVPGNLKYTFNGSCLVLKAPNESETMTFVRAY